MIQAAETRQNLRRELEMKIEATIKGFLSEFERAGIPAVIARNVHYIPSMIVDGGDIDIAIPSSVTEEQLISLISDYGLIHWVSKKKTLYAFFRITDAYILRVDFGHGVNQWLGADYFDESRVFTNFDIENGYRVADRNTQAILKWLPGLLTNTHYKERYGEEIVAAARHDPEGFRAILKNALGENLGEQYLTWAINGTPELSANVIRETRDAVWWRAFRGKPLATLAGLINHCWVEILFRLKLRPGGISVALLGPDGSGKTTLSTRLIEAPYQQLPFRDKCKRRFSFPGLTPLMRKGRARVFGEDGIVVSGPHDKKQHNPIVGFIRLSYTLLRFWIAEFTWARGRIAKNALIIYDRHLIDVTVDPARLRFKGPDWVSRRFGNLAPQPELVILLDAPAEIVHPRKREVPFEETERQRRAYLELVRGMDYAVVIDASCPVDELVDEVHLIINEFMMSRTRKRIQRVQPYTAPRLEKALA